MSLFGFVIETLCFFAMMLLALTVPAFGLSRILWLLNIAIYHHAHRKRRCKQSHVE